MVDLQSLIDREMDRAGLPVFSLDDVARRRDRKRRNQQVGSAVLALIIAVAAIGGLFAAFRKPESSLYQNHPLVSKHALSVTEYPVPSTYGPQTIAAGSQRGAWFVLPNDDAIGRVTRAGSVVTIPLPGAFQEPLGITQGAGGSAWFTESGGSSGCGPNPRICPTTEGVGRIDALGVIKEFPLPPNSGPYGIATSPDGNLWFTETGRIARITPSGTVTTIPVQLHNDPLNIVAGPDGALWFTEDGMVNGGSGAIGRMTTSGTLTEYVLPTQAGHRSGAGDIAVGSDGNLWFTWVTSEVGPAAASIGRITPSGTITRFPVSEDNGWPAGGITAGLDGSLWFTLGSANMIGRILTTGTVTLFRLPAGSSFPSDIARGSHGFIWFSEAEPSAIGRFQVRGSSPALKR